MLGALSQHSRGGDVHIQQDLALPVSSLARRRHPAALRPCRAKNLPLRGTLNHSLLHLRIDLDAMVRGEGRAQHFKDAARVACAKLIKADEFQSRGQRVRDESPLMIRSGSGDQPDAMVQCVAQ